jgi:hypothetical protein
MVFPTCVGVNYYKVGQSLSLQCFYTSMGVNFGTFYVALNLVLILRTAYGYNHDKN